MTDEVIQGQATSFDIVRYLPCLTLSLHVQSMNATAAVRLVMLWNAETGDCLRSLDQHSGAITCLAWMPDGADVFSHRPQGLGWNPALIAGREMFVGSLCHGSMRVLADDYPVLSHGLTLLQYTFGFGEHWPCCLSQALAKAAQKAAQSCCAGKRLVMGGADKVVSMFDVNGAQLRSWKGAGTQDMAITPDGRLLFTQFGEEKVCAGVFVD